jgi:hypothetical protein
MAKLIGFFLQLPIMNAPKKCSYFFNLIQDNRKAAVHDFEGFRLVDREGIVWIDSKFWEELITYFLWYDTGQIENNASNNS